MTVLAGLVVGGLLGWVQARRAGATGLDQAHYIAVGTIICGTLSVFALIILSRMS